MSHSLSRRSLLLHGSRALLAGACLPTFRGLSQMTDAALSSLGGAPVVDYRAIVVVFLSGGNDSYNLVAPTDTTGYGVYAASRGNLAVPQNQLLPITPQAGADTRQWGVHPAATAVQTLFEAGQLALIGNVGPLLSPMNKAQYQNGSVPKPAHLFSHSDQTTLWQMPSARDDVAWGWAGRMADLVLSLNNGSPLSPAISIAGSTRLLRGQTVVPYTMGTSGSVALSGMTGTRGTKRLQTLRSLLALPQGHPMERQFADLNDQAIELDAVIRAALATAPAMTTTFGTDSLAKQMQMVAKMISVRGSVGAMRQVFFVRQGGYDTHANQANDQPVLLGQLSGALGAFQAAMTELGVAANVTTCTMSEFGRTLSSNGDGSDHGWGGNQIVMGGAVQGRRIVGTMPNLALNGIDDVGAGRMLPTTSCDQVAATLAKWFGVAPGDLNTLFPRLSQFAAADLGFLV